MQPFAWLRNVVALDWIQSIYFTSQIDQSNRIGAGSNTEPHRQTITTASVDLAKSPTILFGFPLTASSQRLKTRLYILANLNPLVTTIGISIQLLCLLVRCIGHANYCIRCVAADVIVVRDSDSGPEDTITEQHKGLGAVMILFAIFNSWRRPEHLCAKTCVNWHTL